MCFGEIISLLFLSQWCMSIFSKSGLMSECFIKHRAFKLALIVLFLGHFFTKFLENLKIWSLIVPEPIGSLRRLLGRRSSKANFQQFHRWASLQPLVHTRAGRLKPKWSLLKSEWFVLESSLTHFYHGFPSYYIPMLSNHTFNNIFSWMKDTCRMLYEHNSSIEVSRYYVFAVMIDGSRLISSCTYVSSVPCIIFLFCFLKFL